MRIRRAALLSLAIGCSALVAAPANAERTLRLSLQVAVSHALGQNILHFKERVEDLSDGEITVEIYDAAQLYKGSEIPQAVASGAIDMGLVLIDEFAGTVPVASVFSVAFMFPSQEILAKAAAPDSEVRRIIDEQIAETGARPLWWQDYGPVQLLSNGGGLTSPEDMEGEKVRALGKATGQFVEAVGGIPVKISGSEQFLAYQRGTVDIGMTGTTAIETRKLYEVMDTVTMTNHAQTEFLIVISDSLWQDLSEEEREILSEAAWSAEQKLREETAANNAASEEFIADEGMNVVHLTPEQREAWREAAAPAIDLFLESAGEQGEALVEEIRKLY